MVLISFRVFNIHSKTDEFVIACEIQWLKKKFVADSHCIFRLFAVNFFHFTVHCVQVWMKSCKLKLDWEVYFYQTSNNPISYDLLILSSHKRNVHADIPWPLNKSIDSEHNDAYRRNFHSPSVESISVNARIGVYVQFFISQKCESIKIQWWSAKWRGRKRWMTDLLKTGLSTGINLVFRQVPMKIWEFGKNCSESTKNAKNTKASQNTPPLYAIQPICYLAC